ncbi:extracellular solute-binding protein [Paenibacillus sp. IB182496]|uniref:Extracellular solute-binding protein n=1 Tax=Paenibacillus sabuli TaxID=2772509 RepID=A0A927BU36_9BACL|nr:extracellular solute-binding protein [Paenibacillus sabuli]MBD2845780.1 extracellular solute-binding protein [Paenibacillus sabuli]
MKTNWKPLAALALTAAMLAGCASGNGGGDGAGTNGAGTGGNTGANGGGANKEQNGGERSTVTLEVIEPGNNLPAPDRDIIKQELDKALDLNLNLTVYPSGDDYMNQLNVRMASGNFPDLFSVSREQLLQFAAQGLLLDLTDYMDDLDQVKSFIGEESLKKGMVDGKVYAVSKSPQVPYNTYWIRQDWLDALGLELPQTIEELQEVAVAFTEQDPDGNGKKDTFGLTGGKFSAFAPVFGAFGVGMPGNFYVKDGEVVNALYDPAMRDALAFIQGFIDTGAVDPELLANSGLQHQEKAIKGQAGIIWIDWPNMTKDQFVEQIETVNPDAEWVQLEAPEGPAGRFDGSYDIGSTPGRYAIPKALEKEPEKLQRVFELLNYISDPDGGSKVVQFGVEGTHYEVQDGEIVTLDAMADVAHSWLYQFTGRPEMEYLKAKFPKQAAYMEYAAEQPRIEALNGFVDFPAGYTATDADRYIEEELAKFIYGRNALDNYDQFLQTLETAMNYKTFTDSALEQLAALGYGG